MDESTAIPNSTTTTHIRTEYHSKSGKSARTCRINDPSFHTSSTLQPPPNHDPWSPFFAMHEDFLVSEFLIEAAVNADLANKLLAIFELCQAGKGRVTLSKFSQVKAAWERTLVQLTPFELSRVDVKYKNEERNFNVYHHPLWDWATDLIQSPQLAPYFHWDAEKIYRCSDVSESSTRVFNEPWSADVFWEAQVL
ncbi:hypothetical protein V8E53_013874 [Lactarius tabidus]